jgi:hypothetical protein
VRQAEQLQEDFHVLVQEVESAISILTHLRLGIQLFPQKGQESKGDELYSRVLLHKRDQSGILGGFLEDAGHFLHLLLHIFQVDPDRLLALKALAKVFKVNAVGCQDGLDS